MPTEFARIWYRPGARTVSLDLLQKRLQDHLGCLCERDPGPPDRLRITEPAAFSLCIDNSDAVAEQAGLFAERLEAHTGPTAATSMLRTCTRRLILEAGDAPDDPAAQRILVGLTSGLNGVCEDLAHNRVVMAPRKNLLNRLLRR
ncbi:hypothetical protein SuNHUV7_35060 (plasmid) [Pseudoseohaeicola sp. NH-UV-7]